MAHMFFAKLKAMSTAKCIHPWRQLEATEKPYKVGPLPVINGVITTINELING